MVAVSTRSANCRRAVLILPTPRAQSLAHDSGMEAGTEGILQWAGRWERADKLDALAPSVTQLPATTEIDWVRAWAPAS